LHRRSVLFRIPAGDGHLRARRRQALRHAEADAAVAAGDQGGLAFQVEEVHPSIMAYLTKASIDAVRHFNRFYTRQIGVLKPGMVGSPYTLPEARVLYELGQVPQATATEVGRALGMDLGYLSRLVQTLKRRGLLQARRAPHDGRHSFLSLTD